MLAAHFPAGNGEIIGRLEAFGQTKTYGGQSELPVFENDAWIETALRFGYRSNSGWDVIAYVENVLDEEYFDRTAEDSGIIPGFAFGPSRPRTIGVRFGWTFE